MEKLRKRLSYANVMSSLAVFLVLAGGAAYAALGKNTVGSRQLKPKAVKSAKLAPKAVKRSKIAKNAISTNRLRSGAVTDAKLATEYLPVATEGVPLAGARVAADGTLLRWFNRAGGAPSVSKLGTGLYKLIFPGFENQFPADESIGMVSLVEEISGEVNLLSQEGDPLIETGTSAGAAADKAFGLVLFQPGP